MLSTLRAIFGTPTEQEQGFSSFSHAPAPMHPQASTLVSGYRVQMLDDNDVHVERFYEIDCRLIGFPISERLP